MNAGAPSSGVVAGFEEEVVIRSWTRRPAMSMYVDHLKEGLAAVAKKVLLRWRDRLFAVSVLKGGGEREEAPWSDNTAAVLVGGGGADQKTGRVEEG